MTALIPTPKIQSSARDDERIDEAEQAAAAFTLLLGSDPGAIAGRSTHPAP